MASVQCSARSALRLAPALASRINLTRCTHLCGSHTEVQQECWSLQHRNSAALWSPDPRGTAYWLNWGPNGFTLN